MLAPLGLDHSYTANSLRSGGASRPASRVSAAVKYCSAQMAALLFGSRDARPSRALSPFRKAEPTFTAVASARKIIWVRPDDIVFKVVGDHDLHADDILPGDWDLDRTLVAETKKYKSIYRHFRDGCPWDDTLLFQSYSKRLRRGEPVRGVDSLPQLKRLYEKKVDAAFRDLREHGFRIARDLLGQPTNLPHVHIGRGGEILYGRRENHRLAMAKLLSLRVIPCNVRARHADWQKVREAVLDAQALTKDGTPPSNAHAAFIGHPDLADLYFPNQ